ncbi:hypothetical protein AWQ21_01800 [Picosynechococcus sp. PCC 7003]|nr:hypothetical protein AWQ21_01800 [Picosynechococcus sp. PCC 7003]
MDVVFYSQSNVQKVSSLKWLSRVPQTIGMAKKLIQESTEIWTTVEYHLPVYQMWKTKQNYRREEQQ